MTFNQYDKLYSDYDGVVCFFAEDDLILYANEVFASLLGYEQREIINMNLMEMIHPDDRTEFTNKVFLDSQHQNMTIRLYHKFGSHVYFSISVYPFEHRFLLIGSQMKRQYKGFNFDLTKEEVLSGKTTFETTVNDITEILGENIDTIRMILDNLPIDFWIKDANSRYVYLNKALLQQNKKAQRIVVVLFFDNNILDLTLAKLWRATSFFETWFLTFFDPWVTRN